ncbi:protein POOR HOMOLOGOUS SYNAPSIS 1 [Cucurbita pepo subsp. pepo]|uniref:protein POOR HOMOLOGOUS SYNAPSIS 1 n=1 Tax=Cucurbita pepo subsp. pepo TaxID=3664 RepID=UPI000C9D2A98|nr:protein POOR HOMOLOGOUS SYNAPSIS 1 [Cucurbita pepo subsp. pepo]XP_023538056.1 protein POOR HOMOLOGOUS SYNAPSIS 1 [Cucurbita pepo subsp. pepo]
MAGFEGGEQSKEKAEMPFAAIRDQWEVQFSRFVCYPSTTSTSNDTDTDTNTNLRPLLLNARNRPPRGTWISSSSTAVLQLLHHCSASDLILAVRFRDKILEEHYLSKLHFSWPQMCCISGFPARGTRTIFGSYRDSADEIQKFALRFSTSCEIDSFVSILKEMSKDARDIQPISCDFGSQISSELLCSNTNRPSDSLSEELSNSTVLQPYTPEMPLSLKDTAEKYSSSQENVHVDHLESIFAALPPSFTSMVSNCSDVKQGPTATPPSATKDNDLKSQIMKCMEDSSFQDMLNRVEKIVGEIGGDLAL